LSYVAIVKKQPEVSIVEYIVLAFIVSFTVEELNQVFFL